MEEVCCEVLVQNYSSFKNVGVGQSIESEAIEVGGHSFTLRFYPQGRDQRSHIDNSMSLCIKNQSAESVEVVYAFEFMEQYPFPARSQLGRCSQFQDRGVYRRVTTLGPGFEYGNSFTRHLFDKPMKYVRRDSIRISTTIGVFVRKPLATVCDRMVLFRVGGTRFFAEESLLRIRCPALLQPDDARFTDDDIVLDVDPDVFDVCFFSPFLLWMYMHVL